MAEVRAAALIAIVAIAPLAIIIIVALLRSYDISVTLRRRDKKQRGE